MTENKSSEDIDLLQLLIKTLKIIKSNTIIIVSFFLVGSLIGFLWYSTAPKVYESKMMVSSEILTESYSKELIENLNQLISENNPVAFASKLNLSAEESQKIRKIEIENANGKPETLKEDEKIFLIITVFISDQSILPKLQKNIIAYLENNDYARVRVEQKKKFYLSMITKVNEEISGLEDFKNKIYKGDFFATVKGNVMFDPTSVNTKIIDLTKQRIEYENSLQIVNSVQVVNSFTIFSKPTSPKLSISLVSGAFIGLIFVGILIAYKGIRKIMSLDENS